MSIYVCYTIMHVYITLLKKLTLEKNSKTIIVITDHIADYYEIADRLKQQRLFDDVIIVKDKYLSTEFSADKFNFLAYRKKLVRYFDSENVMLANIMQSMESDIYIFLDQTRMSQYLIYKSGEVTLIEDGLGLYVNRRNSFRDLVKTKLFSMPKSFGRDKAIKTIEATHPERLPVETGHKAVKLDIASMEKALTVNDKKMLFNVLVSENYSEIEEEQILLLTGPYSEEKIISEQEKRELYNRIISKYAANKTVYIKPHPRETTDYTTESGDNIKVLDRNFPIEILNVFMSGKFEKCITIDSSAIKNLNCVREKIFLGLDFDKHLAAQHYIKYGKNTSSD